MSDTLLPYIVVAGTGIAVLAGGLYIMDLLVNSLSNAPSYIIVVVLPLATGIAVSLFMLYKRLLTREVSSSA